MSVSTTPQANKMPAAARAAMQLQVFLLRRNWMGAMGEQLMVITTTGRRSGRQFSTPIGFVRDGETIIALTRGENGGSNWYRNLRKHPTTVLEIQGQKITARAEPVDDPAEKERILEAYKSQRAQNFKVYFGVPADASAETLQQALATRWFVRFTPLD